MDKEVKDFIKQDVLNRFLTYVKIATDSSETTGTHPSTKQQFELAEILAAEMRELGLSDVEVDEYCYLYGTLPASDGIDTPAVTFCAHMDTSPSEPGKDVKPRIIDDYQGGDIRFPDNGELVLSEKDSPELRRYIGKTLITASGKTLLGADDKAGIAEIMTAVAVLQRNKAIAHPELKIVFTPDEEIGEGTAKINMKRLAGFGYTLDGSLEGHMEDECFDAYGVKLIFKGINVHPGFAKDRMINAAQTACRFMAAIPEWEQPEHTSEREGFFT